MVVVVVAVAVAVVLAQLIIQKLKILQFSADRTLPGWMMARL